MTFIDPIKSTVPRVEYDKRLLNTVFAERDESISQTSGDIMKLYRGRKVPLVEKAIHCDNQRARCVYLLPEGERVCREAEREIYGSVSGSDPEYMI